VCQLGTSGLQYDIKNGRTFTAAGFFEAVGWGMASGAIGGVLGGVPGMPVLEDAMNGLSQLLAKSGISLGLAKSGINVLV